MATTGTQQSGTATGLADALKYVYDKPFENNIEKESEILDFIQTAEGYTKSGPDGKGIVIEHTFSSGGGVGAMPQDGYLPKATTPTVKNSTASLKQLSAVAEVTGQVMRRMQSDQASFENWAETMLPRRAQRLAFHIDRMGLGLGNGIIGRYTGTPSGTLDGIGHAFGIPNLEGAEKLILRDDLVRCGPNANASSLRVGEMQVALVNQATGAISTTVNGSAAAATSAAQNDYLFLGDSAMTIANGQEVTGLEALIDDGNLAATLQGLSRASYPELCAQVVDATAGGFTGALTESLVDYADQLCYERGNLGRPDKILASRSGLRSLWISLKADRQISDARSVMSGDYKGGKKSVTLILGDREVEVRVARKVPISRAYLLDPQAIMRYENGTGRWDDTDGSVWNRVVDGTGRKDAFFAVYIKELELAANNPASCAKITGLSAA